MDNVSNALKAFVIAGGVLILAGTATLVAMIMLRSADEREAAAPTPAAVDLALPKGAWIEQVMANGSRLVLLLSDPGGQQYLAVVDALSGERLSLIRTRPEE